MIVELEKQIPDIQSRSCVEVSVAPCLGSHLQYDIAGSENMDAETSVDCCVSVEEWDISEGTHADKDSDGHQSADRETHDVVPLIGQT